MYCRKHGINFYFFAGILSLLMIKIIPAQEALLSDTEQYYDFLALQGAAERPYLNYRTLSDSVWAIDEGTSHLWQEHKLKSIYHPFEKVVLRVYGPELFMSLNTAAPYGQNDGALWQGKGINTSLTGGVRLEGYGLELTFKPQLVFSQNLAFDIMDSSYDSKFGYFWGYAHNVGVDAPQRFGDRPFFAYDWGDSEIRYTWKTLTAGFGTQAIWLGSGRINSILHSNNAPSYPKFDFGIRRQSITIPKINLYIGDIEIRTWAGYLNESEYFDNDDTNNNNLITGLAFTYAPSFLPGFSLYANRTFLSKWEIKNLIYITELFLKKWTQREEDQRASIGANYFLTKARIEVYGELGIDDYVAGDIGYIRYPFHTMAYLVGLRKIIEITKNLKGELIFEWSNFEMSQDFQFQWPTTFYGHHQITQGYTNNGQWLGAGIGTGGNSQYLGFKVYYPKGYGLFYIYRINPDNDYLYKNTINTILSDKINETAKDFYSFNAKLSFGIEGMHFIKKHFCVGGGFVYQRIINPNYTIISNQNDEKHTELNNFHISFRVQIYF
jgi:hypothetical protein